MIIQDIIRNAEEFAKQYEYDEPICKVDNYKGIIRFHFYNSPSYRAFKCSIILNHDNPREVIQQAFDNRFNYKEGDLY